MKEIVKCGECKHHFLNGGDCDGCIIVSEGHVHNIVELESCDKGEKFEDKKEG